MLATHGAAIALNQRGVLVVLAALCGLGLKITTATAHKRLLVALAHQVAVVACWALTRMAIAIVITRATATPMVVAVQEVSLRHNRPTWSHWML